MNAIFALLLALSALVSPALANPQNLVTVQTGAATLTEGETGTLEVTVVVPPGFHVYRDMLHVEALYADGLTLGAVDFPPGFMKPDPANPANEREQYDICLLYTSPSPRDLTTSRMPSSA